MLRAVGYIAGVIVLAALVFFVAREVVEREKHRQTKVQEYNCARYGAAINAYVGKEVCPPTPNG